MNKLQATLPPAIEQALLMVEMYKRDNTRILNLSKNEDGTIACREYELRSWDVVLTQDDINAQLAEQTKKLEDLQTMKIL